MSETIVGAFRPGSAPPGAADNTIRPKTLHEQLFDRAEEQLGDYDDWLARNRDSTGQQTVRFIEQYGLRSNNPIGLKSNEEKEAEAIRDRHREVLRRQVAAEAEQGYEAARRVVAAAIEEAEALAGVFWDASCNIVQGKLTDVGEVAAALQDAERDLARLRRLHAAVTDAVQREELKLARPLQYVDAWWSRHPSAQERRPAVFRADGGQIEMPPDVRPERPRVEVLATAVQKAEEKLAGLRDDFTELAEKQRRYEAALQAADAANAGTGRPSEADLTRRAERIQQRGVF